MKKAFIIPMIIALLVAVVAGAACDETEKAKLPALKVGDQWVYQWVQDATEYTVTQLVTGDEVVGGA